MPVSAIAYVFVNLVIDLLYMWADPRVQLKQACHDDEPFGRHGRVSAAWRSARAPNRVFADAGPPGAAPTGRIGLVTLGLIVLDALFGQWLVPYDPLTLEMPNRLQPTSWQH